MSYSLISGDATAAEIAAVTKSLDTSLAKWQQYIDQSQGSLNITLARIPTLTIATTFFAGYITNPGILKPAASANITLNLTDFDILPNYLQDETFLHELGHVNGIYTTISTDAYHTIWDTHLVNGTVTDDVFGPWGGLLVTNGGSHIDGTVMAPAAEIHDKIEPLVLAAEQVAGNNVAFPLFNATYYLANNPDVSAAGVDAWAHYNQYGWQEGRNPSANFDTDHYLATNPDVASAHVNPLTHYDIYGWKENRQV